MAQEIMLACERIARYPQKERLMQWYYAQQGKQIGPLTEDDFQKLVFAGTITPQTLVWRSGMPDWVAYGTLHPTAETNSAVPAAGTCCECGHMFQQDDMIKYGDSLVCASCKPLFFQRMQEGAILPGTFDYAGFWIRFAAKFLDSIILGIVNIILSFAIVGTAMGAKPGTTIVAQLLLMMIGLVIRFAYCVFFVGKFGATPGKMACKVKIVRADGSPVSYGRAVGRFFAEILSGMILGIGYIMIAFDDEKRALHDRICDTRVIKCQ